MDWWGKEPSTTARPPDPALALLQQLVDDIDELPAYVPKRNYAARRRDAHPPHALDFNETRALFAENLTALLEGGYLDDALGPSCCDAAEPQDGQLVLQGLVDLDAPLWPISDDVVSAWDEDTFLSVIEAYFDLVARPRRRTWHDYCREWDYEDFSRPVGQEVYLWKVNILLERSTIPLSLSAGGLDRGQLVTRVDDPRADLYELPSQMTQAYEADDVAHAIQLWRSRHASRADKRDAVTRLANLLEPHRPLLAQGVGKPDTDALFNIANNFDLRHHNARQHRDYPEEVLDWLFWWYLATLELATRLTA